MGRFLTIVIALSGVSVGCGRLGFDDMGPGAKPAGNVIQTGPGTTIGPTPATTVQVCATSSFTTPLVAGVDDLDLAVAVTTAGPSLFGVDKAGGNLLGMELAGEFATTASAPKVVNNGNFSATSASYVAGKTIAAAMSGTTIVVQMVPPGLSNPTTFGMLDGMYVSKNTMSLANGNRITPTSCSSGLTVNPFDTSWNPVASQLSVTTSQSTGITSTAFGTDAMVVWSTTSSCHLERVINFGTGSGGMTNSPCSSPRIAANVATSTGMLAFEAADGIHTSTFSANAFGASTPLIAPNGTSPRIVFDGTSYWVAYVEGNGVLAVGFIDASGKLQATVTDLTARRDAFELTTVNGNVWVVAADHTGVAAREICVQ